MVAPPYRALIIAASFVAFYVMDIRLMRRYDPQREFGSARNWSFTIVMMLTVVFLASQPVVWPKLGLQIDTWWGLLVQSLGVVALAGGLALSWWARMHLGPFYDERGGDTQVGQYVVDTGPYAYIRHPCSASWFAIAAGLLLINPAIPTLVIAVYAFSSFIVTAPPLEEKILTASVRGYSEYMARTPRFLPRLRLRERRRRGLS